MIESLKIQNYQSHKNSYLKFHPGVNVLTGISDHGKSAIMRALRWLVWNRPSGDGFRSWWGGDTEVTIVADGKSVTRYKGTENLYRIDGIKDPLEGFGTAVPNEIQKVLNLSEINLQQQLDSPFLLTKSPGAVASHFNKVAHLDKIDSTRQNIAKQIREIEGIIKYSKDQLKKHQEKLEQYPDLDKIESKLESLESSEKKMLALTEDKYDLKDITSSLKEVNESIQEESEIIKAEEAVDNLLIKIAERRAKTKMVIRICELITDINEISEMIADQEEILESENMVDMVLSKIQQKDILMANLNVLDGHLYKISTIEKTLRKTEKMVLELEKEFRDNFPEVCPLCGTPKNDIKLGNYIHDRIRK